MVAEQNHGHGHQQGGRNPFPCHIADNEAEMRVIDQEKIEEIVEKADERNEKIDAFMDSVEEKREARKSLLEKEIPSLTEVILSEEERAKKRTRKETIEMLQKRYGTANQTKREEDVSHV